MLGDGRLRGFKVGGQGRFSRHRIESWLRQQQADVEPTGSTVVSPVRREHSPLSDTLPLSCVLAIQDIFAEAMDVAAVTTAMDGTPLTAVAHSCRFCSLILGTPAGRQRCVDSWRAAAVDRRAVLSAPESRDLLQEMFGPRVAFDRLERLIYSHSVASPCYRHSWA